MNYLWTLILLLVGCSVTLAAPAPLPKPLPLTKVRWAIIQNTAHRVQFHPDGTYYLQDPDPKASCWVGTWKQVGNRVYVKERETWMSEENVPQTSRLYHDQFEIVKQSHGVLHCRGWTSGYFDLR